MPHCSAVRQVSTSKTLIAGKPSFWCSPPANPRPTLAVLCEATSRP